MSTFNQHCTLEDLLRHVKEECTASAHDQVQKLVKGRLEKRRPAIAKAADWLSPAGREFAVQVKV